MKTLHTLICLCGILLPCSQALADIITLPTSLSPGQQYRLAFVTSGGRNAHSNLISDYDSFVSDAANAVPQLQALGTTWNAIASTQFTDARVTTNTVPSTVQGGSAGVPIFLLNDSLLASSNDDLWDGSVNTAFNWTELGTVRSGDVWTGTTFDGLREVGLGNVNISIATVGRTSEINSAWVNHHRDAKAHSRAIYAISGTLIAGVPEPSSTILVTTSALVCLLRRNRS